MLVIEHDMKFVEDIAHKVTVLHQGQILSEGSMEKVQNDPKVIEVYLGHLRMIGHLAEAPSLRRSVGIRFREPTATKLSSLQFWFSGLLSPNVTLARGAGLRWLAMTN